MEGQKKGRVVQTEEKGKCGACIPRKGSVWKRPNLSSQGQNSGLKNHGCSPSPGLSPPIVPSPSHGLSQILDSSPPFGPSLAQGLSPSQGIKTKKRSLVGLEEGHGRERLQEPKPMQHTSTHKNVLKGRILSEERDLSPRSASRQENYSGEMAWRRSNIKMKSNCTGM